MRNSSSFKEMTDDELINWIKMDKQAESEFYRRYKNRVKNMVKKYRLNHLEREDLIQEGMIGLFQALETFDTGKQILFRTYSTVCIKNRIINTLETIWKHKKNIDHDLDLEDVVEKYNPEAAMIMEDISDRVKDVISLCTDLEKKVLDGYINGKSYKSIAEELEISTKKVDNILLKLKKKLASFSEELKNLDREKFKGVLSGSIYRKKGNGLR